MKKLLPDTTVLAVSDNHLGILPAEHEITFYSNMAKSVRTVPVRWGSALFNAGAAAACNRTYCNDLATVLMSLSTAAYNGEYICRSMTALGFYDIELYHYPGHPNNKTEQRLAQFDTGHVLARRDLTVDGMVRSVIIVVVRGSSSLMDGVRNAQVTPFQEDIHRGFSYAEAEVRQHLQSYMNRHGLLESTDKNMLLLTGHSLGGATTNLLGRVLTNSQELAPASGVYAYTFACPNTATQVFIKTEAAYDNIFNIVIREDIVTTVPPMGWYWKFGTTLTFPTKRVNRNEYRDTYREMYARGFEKLTGIPRDSDEGKALVPPDSPVGVFHHSPEVYLTWLLITPPQHPEEPPAYIYMPTPGDINIAAESSIGGIPLPWNVSVQLGKKPSLDIDVNIDVTVNALRDKLKSLLSR